MKLISTLQDGDWVRSIYLCRQKMEAKTKVGKDYYSLTLQDRSGSIIAKVWDLSSGIEEFEVNDFVAIEGEVKTFQGHPQLNIRRLRVAGPGEYDPEDFLPQSQYDIGGMFDQLKKFIESIGNEKMRALCDSFFIEDEAFAAEFKRHSAAKSVHHGFVGGLLEHTLSVLKLCEFFTRRYAFLDRDLLITAAMLHDIGKTRELSDFPANDYTDEGQLLGHIVMGDHMVAEHIAKIEGFPKTKAAELRHCILAHHGEFEFGSPKKPALAEALALHYADNIDAKLETFKEQLENAEPGVWQGFNRLLDSNIRKTT